jgi:hypothetical protein
MPEGLNAKAKAAVLEFNERAACDQLFMVEWDIRTELEKSELVSAAPHGGYLLWRLRAATVSRVRCL